MAVRAALITNIPWRVSVARKSRSTVGRPRASKKPVGDSARDDILLAAARLFGKHGYAGTSTHKIADAVGIRQPSLFTHFKKKEDILRELVQKSAAIVGDIVDRNRTRQGRGCDRLYTLMREDFLYLLTEPYGVGALMQLPEARNGSLGKNVGGVRQRLIDLYGEIIEQGVEEGDFVADDLAVTANTVFGMGEALWSWYTPTAGLAPERIAEQIADLGMRAVLAKPSALSRIKARYKPVTTA